MLEALGSLIYRRRWTTLVCAGLFLVGALLLLLRGGRLTGSSIAGLEADATERVLAKILGRDPETTVLVLFHSGSLSTNEPAFGEAMAAALAPARESEGVLSVTTPSNAPPGLAERMVGRDQHSAFALVALRGDFDEASKTYAALRPKLLSKELSLACTGAVPTMHDLDETLEHDLLRAELVSLPLALLVLLLVFRSVVAAALPVGVGALAVVGGIALVLALSRVTDIASYTLNVCSLIGLGVAIDYSLFTVARYREELAAGQSLRDALVIAVAKAGRVIAFSGLAVGTGLAGLLFFEGSYLFSMGLGGMIVVGLAVVFALTFLPALLAVLGPRVNAGRLPLSRQPGRESTAWHRVALAVMRHPVLTLVPTLGLLLWMGIPFLRLQFATTDVRVLPPGTEARRAYEELRRDFPDVAATTLDVAVTFPTAPALTVERLQALRAYVERVAALPGVEKVESVIDVLKGMQQAAPGVPLATLEEALVSPPAEYAEVLSKAKSLTVGDDSTVVEVLTRAAPESETARNLVKTLREDRRVGDGTVLVGGVTATDLDTTEFILSRTPLAVGVVVLVTLVVLFFLLRSVILPVKAVLMNAVSIAGSFGALVWIFQEGHLFVTEPRPLEPSLPILLFCILFGLSMDYEVLMLSRMREAYERTGDNTLAVAEGLEKSAGLITSAAAIMVAVFGAFALARVVLIQAVGVGMALAVTLDATVVRTLLVPATMRLLGELNWWAPRFARRGRRDG